MKLAVHTLDGKEAGEISLEKTVFGIEPRVDIIPPDGELPAC